MKSYYHLPHPIPYDNRPSTPTPPTSPPSPHLPTHENTTRPSITAPAHSPHPQPLHHHTTRFHHHTTRPSSAPQPQPSIYPYDARPSTTTTSTALSSRSFLHHPPLYPYEYNNSINTVYKINIYISWRKTAILKSGDKILSSCQSIYIFKEMNCLITR